MFENDILVNLRAAQTFIHTNAQIHAVCNYHTSPQPTSTHFTTLEVGDFSSHLLYDDKILWKNLIFMPCNTLSAT